MCLPGREGCCSGHLCELSRWPHSGAASCGKKCVARPSAWQLWQGGAHGAGCACGLCKQHLGSDASPLRCEQAAVGRGEQRGAEGRGERREQGRCLRAPSGPGRRVRPWSAAARAGPAAAAAVRLVTLLPMQRAYPSLNFTGDSASGQAGIQAGLCQCSTAAPGRVALQGPAALSRPQKSCWKEEAVPDCTACWGARELCLAG